MKWLSALLAFYSSAFRRRGHYVFGLSIRPKPEIPSLHMYMGPFVHLTNRDRFASCPSVRPEMFPDICRRTHGGNGLKFGMLIYLDHPQNWLDYAHGLLFFLLLTRLWLSETGQIRGFRAFPGNAWRKWPGIFHADVSWPLKNWLVYGHGLLIIQILALFWLSETGQIGGSWHFGHAL